MVFRQGQLKGQVYNIEHPTSCFYNLTKPLTRQDLLPYQVYVPWSWEAKPTRIAAAEEVEQPRRCTKAKDIDERKTCYLLLATHENPTVYSPGRNVQVPIRVWLPAVECAAAWPIKKTKQFHLKEIWSLFWKLYFSWKLGRGGAGFLLKKRSSYPPPLSAKCPHNAVILNISPQMVGKQAFSQIFFWKPH